MGRRDWSGLPDELLTKIGKYVSGHFDMIRFRSVCRRWRYSLPLSHTNNWHLQLQITLLKEPKPDYPIRIPLPFYESYDPELEAESSPYHTVPSSIVKTTVCIINQSSLLKLEETQQEGKFRIINPISDIPIKEFPKVLNLLDYPIMEITRGYICKISHSNVLKAVILPEYDDKVCMVLVLCDHGRLLLWRNGDEHVKEISNKFRYDDIAVYKGQFIAIDRWGTVSFVDSSSLKVIQYTPPVLTGGKKKNLVVCSEQLYVADRYFDRARTSQNPYGKWDPSVVDFKIYKLDEDWGRWIEITSLNDQILFLGKVLNFFVPIKELSGCNKGNCIYFKGDEFIGSKSHGVSVFDLADRRIGSILSFPGCSDMLCRPSWFTAN
ncbi:F-box protein SKIP23-like [Gossypium australe]|uniref:F-box protein SKIP23-like n=1 Tax=Gossypium australe TaxID=47621 RepID=A0A5B6UM84_9ROSI|nr:F-box protein SKIP23-like [Gossypium australe]